MLSTLVAVISIVTFIASIVGIYWRMRIEVDRLRTQFGFQIQELTARITSAEKLNCEINEKLDFIGTNIALMLRKLRMKPQKNIFKG